MKPERWTKLAVHMAQRNWTQNDVAEKSSLHLKTIQKGMKFGPNALKMQTITKIAEALECEVKELI